MIAALLVIIFGAAIVLMLDERLVPGPIGPPGARGDRGEPGASDEQVAREVTRLVADYDAWCRHPGNFSKDLSMTAYIRQKGRT